MTAKPVHPPELASPKSAETVDQEEGEEGDEGDDDEWETFHDATSNKPYYHNKKTGQTLWEKPVLDDEGEDDEGEDDEGEDEEGGQQKEDTGDKGKDPGRAPGEWVSILKEYKNLKLADVTLLRTHIVDASKSWKSDFVSEKGLAEFTNILREGTQFADHNDDEKIRLEILRCLESYLDKEEWLTPILSTASLLPNLVLCLAHEGSALRLRALELLSVICWLASEGRRSVLEALESTKFKHPGKSEKGEKFPALTSLVKDLIKHSLDEKTGKVQSNDMVLINSLITPSEVLEERIQTRNKFHELGLDGILEKLSDFMDEKSEKKMSEVDKADLRLLQTQLEIYDGGLIKDSRTTTRENLDLSNPDKLWEYLKSTTREDGFTEQLTSILQMLMTIPEKEETVWNNCKHIVFVATKQDRFKAPPPPTGNVPPPTDPPALNSQNSTTPLTPTAPAPQSSPDTTKPGHGHYWTYEQLKAALDKKEEDDQKEIESKSQGLEKKLEAQRIELHQLRMKAKYSEELKEKYVKAQATMQVLQEEKKKGLWGKGSKKDSSVSSSSGGDSKEVDTGLDTKASITDLLERPLDEVKRSGRPRSRSVPSVNPIFGGSPEVEALQKEVAKLRDDLLKAESKLASGGGGGGGAPPEGGDAPVAPPMDDSAPPPPMDDGPPMAPDMEAPPMAPDMDGPPDAPPMDGGGPPPPPDFGGAPKGPKLKPKKKIEPSVKLRKLHWTKIAENAVSKTLWKEVDDDELITKWQEDWKDDLKNFEDLFTMKETKAAAGGGGGKEGGGEGGEEKESADADDSKGSKKKKKKEAIRLVDEKRSYAADISLARFRMPITLIRDSILSMDTEALSSDKLSQLVKIVPTTEEIATVKAYTGPREELGNTEQFYLVMSEIPKLQTRLEQTIFKLQFPQQLEGVKSNLSAIENTLNQIKTSYHLKTVLRVVLAFGNYLNAGTKTGGAYGFKLATLKQLKNSKAIDNKTTLTMYLVRFIKKFFPEAHRFPDDLKSVAMASKIEKKLIQDDINQIRSKLNQIEAELKVSNDSDPLDRYYAEMNGFFREAKRQFISLDDRFTALEKNFDESVAWFGESSSQMSWEEYFDIFDSFATSYLLAERRVDDEEKLAEKEKKRKEWLEVEQKKKAEKGAAGGGGAGGGKVGGKLKKGKGKKKKKKQLYDNVKDVIKGSDSDAIFSKLQRMRKEKRKEKKEGGESLTAKLGRGKKSKNAKDNEKRQQIKEILSGIKKPKAEVKTPIIGATIPGTEGVVSPKKPKKPGAKKVPFEIAKKRPKAPHEVPPCKECQCKEYNAHPFKPNYCNKCYHNHM